MNNEHETFETLRLVRLPRLWDQFNHLHHAEVVKFQYVFTFRLIFVDSLAVLPG